jgi:NADPH:quinone reductase-like Zn-dependent oxidoreductase
VKAVRHVGYGDPANATAFGEAEKPVATGKQVLVRVVASSINAGDWRAVYASPWWIRLLSGYRRPRDPALGGDAAGVVEALGPDATDLRIGDEVFGIRSGGLAEYVSGENFVRKPTNLSFEQAGVVPIAGVTALQALQKHGHVQPGRKVVINGAGGGVGSFAVQIGKALGAEVTAVTSTDKVDLMRALGADHVVDYERDDFTQDPDRSYDLVIDIGGNRSVSAMRRRLKNGGQVIMVGAGHGGFGVLARIVGGLIRRKLGQPVRFFYAGGPYQEQLITLRELIEAGKVTPVIDRTYPLEQAAEAIRYVAKENVRGKVAISVAPAPGRPQESHAT